MRHYDRPIEIKKGARTSHLYLTPIVIYLASLLQKIQAQFKIDPSICEASIINMDHQIHMLANENEQKIAQCFDDEANTSHLDIDIISQASTDMTFKKMTVIVPLNLGNDDQEPSQESNYASNELDASLSYSSALIHTVADESDSVGSTFFTSTGVNLVALSAVGIAFSLSNKTGVNSTQEKDSELNAQFAAEASSNDIMNNSIPSTDDAGTAVVEAELEEASFNEMADNSIQVTENEVTAVESDENLSQTTEDKLISPVDILHHKIELNENLIPDAPRPYRAGTHKGIDFDAYKEPVYAIANGIVIERSSTDWSEMKPLEYMYVLDQIKHLAYSKGEESIAYQNLLTQLYGQYTTIEHQNGLYSKYAHLDSIADNINIGASITAGELLGYSGNTGTSHSVNNTYGQYHLHFEIYNEENQYFGQGIGADDIEIALQILFDSNKSKVNTLKNLSEVIETQDIEFLIAQKNHLNYVSVSDTNDPDNSTEDGS